MKKRLTAFLLLLCLLLSACGNAPEDIGEALNVYYCAADGGMRSGSSIVKLPFPVSAGTDRLHEALRLLTAEPEDAGLYSAFPANIRIETYRLEDRNIAVTLSDGYQAMAPAERTKLRACLVLTLCGLEEIEQVSLYEEERLLESGLSAAVFLSESLPEGDSGTVLRFWRPDPENGCLVSEMQTVRLRGSTSMPETVLRQLMPLLYDYGLPEGTQILSVSRREGVCSVDLSSEFLGMGTLRPSQLRLLLFSVINTLTELDTVDSVLFRCEGSSIRSLGSMGLLSPFSREEAFTADMMGREDCITVTLYLMAGDGKLTPVKAAVPVQGNAGQPVAAAVQALLTLDTYWG